MKVNVKRLETLVYYTIIITILFVVSIGLCIYLGNKATVERVYIYRDHFIKETVKVEGKAHNAIIKTELKVCSNSQSKTYMSYQAITNTRSSQYKYIKANMTVNEKGLLVDKDGYIGVALGSYFGDIGRRYTITLDTGIILKVVKVEAKADNHTVNGCYQKWDKSVIEFVIDTKKAGNYYGRGSNGYIANGNFNNIKEFKGKIIKIEEEI
jgi:hypothetical protein